MVITVLKFSRGLKSLWGSERLSGILIGFFLSFSQTIFVFSSVFSSRGLCPEKFLTF